MKKFLDLIKIKHWIKNVFVFAPIVFSLKLFDIDLLTREIAASLCFCFVSVLVYIINDIIDRDNDKNHPVKSVRPIASGQISIPVALIVGCLFFAVGAVGAVFIDYHLVVILAAYLLLNILYSLWLKRVVIVDVFIIAIGFCLRIAAGSVAINVRLGHWMLLAVFGLSLFLGFGKRKNEIDSLGDDSAVYRPGYSHYTSRIIDILIMLSASVAVLSYAFYTMDSVTTGKFGSGGLVYSVPFVLFGIFRYIYLLYCENKGSNPEELAVKDWGIIIAVFGWIAVVVYVIYFSSVPDTEVVSEVLHW
ncbi:MAG: decaprenyl-phosphate phosphoribosyltransferase [Spirochaetales bacterium]|nr:decaprenyl-phosphate phosphoribosyltransferase [Spirochaetales bacterium]